MPRGSVRTARRIQRVVLGGQSFTDNNDLSLAKILPGFGVNDLGPAFSVEVIEERFPTRNARFR